MHNITYTIIFAQYDTYFESIQNHCKSFIKIILQPLGYKSYKKSEVQHLE